MYRYGKIEKGKFTGAIEEQPEPYSEYALKTLSLLPIRTIDDVKSTVFFDRYAPVYKVITGVEITETYLWKEKVDIKQAKLDYLASVRWTAETGGFDWHGKTILTDERSRSNYQAELSAISLGERKDGDLWKFPHGFEPTTNAQIQEIATAARRHVLACFAVEAMVSAQIDTLPPDETAIETAFRTALQTLQAKS